MTYLISSYTRCLGHVVNIGVVTFMKHITRIAAVENASAIWEYDPSDPNNRISNGSLDVVAIVRTTAIKVLLFTVSLINLPLIPFQIQVTGKRIDIFMTLQAENGIQPALTIPLHSNIRWSTAHGMLARSYDLQDVSCFRDPFP